MKFPLIFALGLATVFTGTAQASFSYVSFGSSSWGASDTTLGVAGYTIEDFENVNLVSGLQIAVSSNSGNYGPTSTLPNTFNPFTDDAFGNAFQTGGGGQWDGSNGLINTRTNRPFNYNDANSWGSTQFLFSTPANSVGFSVQQMNRDAEIFINGALQGTMTSLTTFSINGSRQGYLRIDATGGSSISSITIVNGSFTAGFGTGDGIMFDHLAFTVVPIPAAAWLFGSALASLGLFAKRRRSDNVF